LERRLADPDADVSALLPVLKRALAERAVHLALHPDAPMQVLSADRLDRVILQRSYGGETLVAVH
jgi:sucrose phosphorylase